MAGNLIDTSFASITLDNNNNNNNDNSNNSNNDNINTAIIIADDDTNNNNNNGNSINNIETNFQQNKDLRKVKNEIGLWESKTVPLEIIALLNENPINNNNNTNNNSEHNDNDDNNNNNNNNNNERVIYWCPPQSDLGDSLIKDLNLTTYTVVASVVVGFSLVISSELVKTSLLLILLFNFFLSSLLIFGGFYVARPHMFGYRVITNHRAAIVIPSKHLFLKPKIIDYQFQPQFEKLVTKELVENTKERSELLEMIEVVRDETDSNRGTVTFNEATPLVFTNVTDLWQLEDILAYSIQQLIRTTPTRIELTKIKQKEEEHKIYKKNNKTWIGLIALLVMAGFVPIAAGLASHLHYIAAFGFGTCMVCVTFSYCYYFYSSSLLLYDQALLAGRIVLYACVDED